jgi:hypothetical protein
MSQRLLWLAGDFNIDNRIVQWEELLGSDTLLNELGIRLSRRGWPSRTPKEIRQELVRLHGRWEKKSKKWSESTRSYMAKDPTWWMDDSEDEDDIFMPPVRGNKSASSSSKGKNHASSSKGKSAASTEEDDDDFM